MKQDRTERPFSSHFRHFGEKDDKFLVRKKKMRNRAIYGRQGRGRRGIGKEKKIKMKNFEWVHPGPVRPLVLGSPGPFQALPGRRRSGPCFKIDNIAIL